MIKDIYSANIEFLSRAQAEAPMNMRMPTPPCD